MNASVQAGLEATRAAALVQAKALVQTGYAGFVASFKDYLEPEDLVLLEDIGSAMLAAKVRQWSAQTDDEARWAQDEYVAAHNGFDALFDAYAIQGGAKVKALAKSLAHQVVAGVFAALGAGVQATFAAFVPVVGGIAGAVLNVGIQKVVSYFQGDA